MKEETVGNNSLPGQDYAKNTESQPSPTYALEMENKLNSGKLLEILPVENTPFHILVTEMGHFITIGNKVITEPKTLKACYEMIEDKEWQIIVSLVVTITERVIEQIKLEDKARNQLTKTEEAKSHTD